MSKVNKVLLIIVFSLLAALGIAILVIYIIDENLIKSWFEMVKEFVDRPLVIAGVSTTIGGAFIYFIVNFIVKNASFGKNKIEQYDNKVNEIEKAKEDFEKAANEQIKLLKEENDKLKGYIADICELSTNQKIKNYGKGLLANGEETTDR